MRSEPAKRDTTKYCKFHKDHGHRIDDCIQLRKEIEYLIKQGHLRHYIASKDHNQAPPPPPHQLAPAQHQQPLREINVISRGFTGGREFSSAKKAHLRSIRSGETLEVQAMSKSPSLDTTITFLDFDMEGCQHPHDDPLVISSIMVNKTMHRILIDNGSSEDIIFAPAFDKMGIGMEKLEPMSAHLLGFSGEKVLPLGSTQMVLTLGNPPCHVTIVVKFLIVDAPSAYNMLLGRPSLNALRVIPFAYHIFIKFLTENGVGVVRGDQRVGRECYPASIKQKAIKSVHMDELDMRDELDTRLTPSKELEPIHLGDQLDHLAYIGSKLAEDIKDRLIRFLRKNAEVFAWKQEDMGGINPAVITHKLNFNPSFKPVK